MVLGKCIACVLALGAPELNTLVDPRNPASVRDALLDLGYRAKLEIEADARPRIRSSESGTNFSISFYACKDDFTDCRGLLFSTSYNLTDGMELADADAWNADALVGRVSLDEDGDPVLDHYIVADFGLSPKTFEATVDAWAGAIGRFEKSIDW